MWGDLEMASVSSQSCTLETVIAQEPVKRPPEQKKELSSFLASSAPAVQSKWSSSTLFWIGY